MYVSVVSAKVAEQKLFIIIKKVGWKVGEGKWSGRGPAKGFGYRGKYIIANS